MRFVLVLVCAVLALSGCADIATAPRSAPGTATRVQSMPTRADADRFRAVVTRVEPVAERICREIRQDRKCDFRVAIDRRAELPPNAFQTLDEDGRPIIAFTLQLIADVQNADELAFIMSHEAAHHIAEHIPRQQQSAMAGAILLGGLASISGASYSTVEAAVDLGATVGARRYSKDFELEADSIGTRVAQEAGYDAVRGAAYFARIPDPGNQFLGTHPPNAQRIEAVRRAADAL